MSAQIPCGFAAVRSDFRHYCRVHRAETVAQKLVLPLSAPSLWALAVYRYGRWIYFGEKKRGLFHRAVYTLLFEAVRHFTQVLVQRWAELDHEVWLASHAPLLLGAKVGRGSFIHQGATLGAGGPPEARGVPSLGEDVVIGPGSTLIGPVAVPAGSVIGPNSVVSRSLATSGAYLGAPAKPWAGARERLVPTV